MRLHVGNLPWKVRDGELQELFESVGPVISARVITDHGTNRSRGFGFVEMEDDLARQAIEKMNGHEVGGRPLRVSEAQQREPRAKASSRW